MIMKIVIGADPTETISRACEIFRQFSLRSMFAFVRFIVLAVMAIALLTL